MTFFRKLRHALGFNDDSIFETDSDTAYDSIPEHSEDTSATPLGKSYVYVTQDMREAIFSHVIKVFNDALPEFLARSVDADTQQKLIFEGLDQGIKDYLARIGADADNRCEQRWSSEQAGMRAEMDDLRRKSEQVAQERADLKQKQLSADRQKRALSDRMKDLENQVRRLEAEREQFDLENKSLLNKLKAIAVRHPELAEETGAQNVPSQEYFDRISAENRNLQEALEQASERSRIADEMTADLRRRLKVSQKEVEDLQAITEQVERVHQAIANRDAKIENQRDTIAKLRTQVDTLKAAAIEAEQKFARREEQLTAQLNTIHIKTDTGGADTEKRNEPAPKKSRKRRARVELQTEDPAPKITDADLVDVEAGFAGHDWFGAPSPEELASQASEPSIDDFGYHAPEPKPRPYDDGMQMSLFD